MYFLICGAYLFSVALSGIFAHDLPPGVPPVVQDYKTFHALNCYIDNLENRALREFVDLSPNMTVELCLDICLAGNFTLGGVENGDECYCGNAILYNPLPDTVDLTACNTVCAGAPLEACGGPFRIEIYQNGETPFTIGDAQLVTKYKNWTANGCFEDSVAARQVPIELPISTAAMTVEKCLDGCQAAAFNVAALQFGEECFCGNVTLPPGVPANNSLCNMPCTGNATEFCGSSNLNWVFSLPSALDNH